MTGWPWTEAASGDDVVLMLTGDTNLQDRAEPASAFARVMPVLVAANAVLGQLEGPLTPPSDDPLAPDIPHKPGWRHSDPRMAEGLIAAGYRALSLASNVAYPPRAVLDTCRHLAAAGIAHAGGGADAAAARAPARIEVRGTRIGLLGYTSVFWPVGHAALAGAPGVATIRAHTAYAPGRRALEMPGAPPVVHTWPDAAELAVMTDDVRRLRPQVDVLIVSCHWGVSGSETPVDYQRAIARAAVDAGADLVFGHHPHCLQGAEFVAGRPVFYSLGNFAFDWDNMRGRHRDGLLLRLLLRDRRLAGLACLPVRRDHDNLIAPADPETVEAAPLVERWRTLCAALGTEVTLEGRELRLERRAGGDLTAAA